MPKKTNKTSHVLNLLSGGDGELQEDKVQKEKSQEKTGGKDQEPSDQKKDDTSTPLPAESKAVSKAAGNAKPAEEAAPAERMFENRSARTGNVSVIHAAGPDTDPVAEAVKDRLQQELEMLAGDGNADAAGQQPPAQKTEEHLPEDQPAAVSEDKKDIIPEDMGQEALPEPETAQAGLPEEEGTSEETSQQQPETGREVAAVAEQPEEINDDAKDSGVPEALEEKGPLKTIQEMQPVEDEYVFINVMEKIVKEKTMSYMKQFGNCTCKRCEADTVALALTNLPPKYIVSKESTVSPLLNFYSDHFAGQVIVEITKACIVVGRNPRHDR